LSQRLMSQDGKTGRGVLRFHRYGIVEISDTIVTQRPPKSLAAELLWRPVAPAHIQKLQRCPNLPNASAMFVAERLSFRCSARNGFDSDLPSSGSLPGAKPNQMQWRCGTTFGLSLTITFTDAGRAPLNGLSQTVPAFAPAKDIWPMEFAIH
jgi:hypothetical protein